MGEKAAVFQGRLGLQQRVLPQYRMAFCEELARACLGGLGVFAGQPLPNESILSVSHLEYARLFHARNYHFRDPGSAWFLLWQSGILKWLKVFQPDALIVEANPRYLSTRLAISWMRKRRRPVLGWGLGAPPLSGPGARLRQWERLQFLQSLDGLIAYSQRGAEQYRALGIPAQKIFVALNAVEPPPVKPPVKKPDIFQGKPVVLFIGRLQRRKRVDNLIYACASLPDFLQPRLIIVGDGPARQELELLAKQIYPQAEFVGAQYGDALEAFYGQADIFVLPGTGGLAVHQAMAHGLPVIVARGDGTQDDLVLPGAGWQIQPDDPQELGRTLHEALLSPPLLRKKGKEAYRIVKERANIVEMVKVFIQALNQTL